MSPPWSIRRWLGALVAGVAVPLLALLVWIYGSEVQQQRAEARGAALRIAKTMKGRLESLHAESLDLLGAMSKRPEIREGKGRDCAALFAVIDFFPQYANLFLYDTAGRLVCSATPAPEDAAASAEMEPWIAAKLRGGTLVQGRPVMRSVGGRWLSAISQTMTAPDGSTRGTLVLLELPDVIRHEVVPSGTAVTVLDASGTILARSEDADKWTGKHALGEIAKLAATQREGVAHAVGVDGVGREYGFTSSRNLGWTIYAGAPTAAVMQPVRQMFVRGVVGGILIVLFVVTFAALLFRSIESPIRRLVRAAGSVAAGSYDTVEERGPAEIRQLAVAFNEMVNARRRAEGRLHDDERKLRALSERLVEVQEEERSRIARELHDDLGQSLTALKMDVIGLTQAGDRPSVPTIRERVLRTVDATVTAVQRISSELRPSVLDDLGLVAALETEARTFEERTGVECESALPHELDVERPVATAIYRIVQEALTNVARHSDATRVEIRLSERDGTLRLEVRDDGRGITDAETSNPRSFGLIGIRERAETLGGKAAFEGVPGRGTIVSVEIPASPRKVE